MIKNNLTFYFSSTILMYGSYNEDWSMDLYYKTMLKLGVKSLKPSKGLELGD